MDTQKLSVLVVDDEPVKRVTLQIELNEAGFEVAEAADAKIALDQLAKKPADVVVSDLRMPGMDGIAFLDEIRRRWPSTDVLIMTAYGTVDTAVAAMKRGAYDFIAKPFRTAVLLEKLERLRVYRAAKSNAGTGGPEFGRLLGSGPAMRELCAQIRAAADGSEPVLIIGEAGTGKTLIAETIHQLSASRSSGLVRFNGEGLTDATAAAELFGVESDVSGVRKTGRYEQAAGGVLLIENVDKLGLQVQARLCGLMGASEGARVVATSRRTFPEIIRRGEFREDLYYRLSWRTLTVPPLRQHSEDVPVLAQCFVERHAPLSTAGTQGISPHAMDLMIGYSWPGNVLELEHAIEQAIVRCGGAEIRPEHLPASICETDPNRVVGVMPEVGQGLTETVADVERRLIEAALRHCNGNQARAAQVLRIPRTTLRDKMTKYGLVGDAPTA